MSEIRNGVLIVPLATGLQLVVMDFQDKTGSASLYHGDWPIGRCLACSVFGVDAPARVYVDEDDGSATLWLGSMTVELPWPELLAVADFLRLDIPVPPTQEVAA